MRAAKYFRLIICAGILTIISGLEADPVLLDPLQTPGFQRPDMDPYFDQANQASSADAWQYTVDQGYAMLSARWEAAVDREIDQRLLQVSGDGGFDSPGEFRAYLQNALSQNKQSHFAAWELAADAAIESERGQFLKRMSARLQNEASADSGADLRAASGAAESDPAATDPDAHYQEWRRNFRTKVGDGLAQFAGALGDIQNSYNELIQQLDDTEASYQSQKQKIEQYETKLRSVIAGAAGGLRGQLQSSGLFYSEVCSAKNECAPDKTQLNAAGQELQGLLASLDDGLRNKAPVSALGRQLADYLGRQKNLAVTRQQYWQDRVVGTGRFAVQGDGARWKYKTITERVCNSQTGVCTDVDRVVRDGYSTPALAQHILDNDQEKIREYLEGNTSDFRKITNITAAGFTGSSAYYDGPFGMADAGRGGHSSQSFDHCINVSPFGNSGCTTSNSGLFYLRWQLWAGINNNHVVEVEQNLLYDFQYTTYDENAASNAATWQNNVAGLTLREAKWRDDLVPALQTWEARAQDFETRYTAWQAESAAARQRARTALQTAQDDIIAERNQWLSGIEDDFRRDRDRWKQIRTRLARSPNGAEDEESARLARDAAARLALSVNSPLPNITKPGLHLPAVPVAHASVPQIDHSAASRSINEIRTTIKGTFNLAVAETMHERAMNLERRAVRNLVEIANRQNGLIRQQRNLPARARAIDAELSDTYAKLSELDFAVTADTRSADIENPQIRALVKTIEELNQERREVLRDDRGNHQDDGFDVRIDEATGGVRLQRSISTGMARLRAGGDQENADDYYSVDRTQTVYLAGPKAMKQTATGDLFGDWDYQKILNDFGAETKAHQQHLREHMQRVSTVLNQANQTALDGERAWRANVEAQVEQAKKFREMLEAIAKSMAGGMSFAQAATDYGQTQFRNQVFGSIARSLAEATGLPVELLMSVVGAKDPRAAIKGFVQSETERLVTTELSKAWGVDQELLTTFLDNKKAKKAAKKAKKQEQLKIAATVVAVAGAAFTGGGSLALLGAVASGAIVGAVQSYSAGDGFEGIVAGAAVGAVGGVIDAGTRLATAGTVGARISYNTRDGFGASASVGVGGLGAGISYSQNGGLALRAGLSGPGLTAGLEARVGTDGRFAGAALTAGYSPGVGLGSDLNAGLRLGFGKDLKFKGGQVYAGFEGDSLGLNLGLNFNERGGTDGVALNARHTDESGRAIGLGIQRSSGGDLSGSLNVSGNTREGDKSVNLGLGFDRDGLTYANANGQTDDGQSVRMGWDKWNNMLFNYQQDSDQFPDNKPAMRLGFDSRTGLSADLRMLLEGTGEDDDLELSLHVGSDGVLAELEDGENLNVQIGGENLSDLEITGVTVALPDLEELGLSLPDLNLAELQRLTEDPARLILENVDLADLGIDPELLDPDILADLGIDPDRLSLADLRALEVDLHALTLERLNDLGVSLSGLDFAAMREIGVDFARLSVDDLEHLGVDLQELAPEMLEELTGLGLDLELRNLGALESELRLAVDNIDVSELARLGVDLADLDPEVIESIEIAQDSLQMIDGMRDLRLDQLLAQNIEIAGLTPESLVELGIDLTGIDPAGLEAIQALGVDLQNLSLTDLETIRTELGLNFDLSAIAFDQLPLDEITTEAVTLAALSELGLEPADLDPERLQELGVDLLPIDGELLEKIKIRPEELRLTDLYDAGLLPPGALDVPGLAEAGFDLSNMSFAELNEMGVDLSRLSLKDLELMNIDLNSADALEFLRLVGIDLSAFDPEDPEYGDWPWNDGPDYIPDPGDGGDGGEDGGPGDGNWGSGVGRQLLSKAQVISALEADRIGVGDKIYLRSQSGDFIWPENRDAEGNPNPTERIRPLKNGAFEVKRRDPDSGKWKIFAHVDISGRRVPATKYTSRKALERRIREFNEFVRLSPKPGLLPERIGRWLEEVGEVDAELLKEVGMERLLPVGEYAPYTYLKKPTDEFLSANDGMAKFKIKYRGSIQIWKKDPARDYAYGEKTEVDLKGRRLPKSLTDKKLSNAQFRRKYAKLFEAPAEKDPSGPQFAGYEFLSDLEVHDMRNMVDNPSTDENELVREIFVSPGEPVKMTKVGHGIYTGTGVKKNANGLEVTTHYKLEVLNNGGFKLFTNGRNPVFVDKRGQVVAARFGLSRTQLAKRLKELEREATLHYEYEKATKYYSDRFRSDKGNTKGTLSGDGINFWKVVGRESKKPPIDIYLQGRNSYHIAKRDSRGRIRRLECVENCAEGRRETIQIYEDGHFVQHIVDDYGKGKFKTYRFKGDTSQWPEDLPELLEDMGPADEIEDEYGWVPEDVTRKPIDPYIKRYLESLRPKPLGWRTKRGKRIPPQVKLSTDPRFSDRLYQIEMKYGLFGGRLVRAGDADLSKEHSYYYQTDGRPYGIDVPDHLKTIDRIPWDHSKRLSNMHYDGKQQRQGDLFVQPGTPFSILEAKDDKFDIVGLLTGGEGQGTALVVEFIDHTNTKRHIQISHLQNALPDWIMAAFNPENKKFTKITGVPVGTTIGFIGSTGNMSAGNSEDGFSRPVPHGHLVFHSHRGWTMPEWGKRAIGFPSNINPHLGWGRGLHDAQMTRLQSALRQQNRNIVQQDKDNARYNIRPGLSIQALKAQKERARDLDSFGQKFRDYAPDIPDVDSLLEKANGHPVKSITGHNAYRVIMAEYRYQCENRFERLKPYKCKYDAVKKLRHGSEHWRALCGKPEQCNIETINSAYRNLYSGNPKQPCR